MGHMTGSNRCMYKERLNKKGLYKGEETVGK